MGLSFQATEFFKVINSAGGAVRKQLLETASASGRELVGICKGAAPWEDKTGKARASIGCSCELYDEYVVIHLFGGMPYSPNLELANEKRFAVLIPVIVQNANAVFEAYAKALG